MHDWINNIIGRLLGLERMQSVSDYKLSFQAGWAQRGPLWLLLGFVGLAAVAAMFYFRFQTVRSKPWRFVLFALRAAVLCQVLLLLAEPVLTLTIQSQKRPALWLLFDGTDSMNIADDLPSEVRMATDRAVGIDSTKLLDGRSPGEVTTMPRPPSRIEYLKALVQKKDDNLLSKLSERFRVQAFLFDSTQSVRSIELSQVAGAQDGTNLDGARIASQLTSSGKVTDIDAALSDLAHRNTSGNLGGLVMFSDFNRNHGPSPDKTARQFGAKIYTVGLGSTEAIDLAAELVADPYAQKNEDTRITVVLRQTGLAGKTAHVRLYAELLGSVSGAAGNRELIGEQSIALSKVSQSIEFMYKPPTAGRFHLVAEADKLPGEVIEENNIARGEFIVLEDYLRMMFVEYEPTWEWRFIKEVFHRDPMVGAKGFRTFLYSSDPQVRRQNELFLPTMSPPRNEFFKNDLIFLGDMPAAPPISALNERFCTMVKEFVGEMGGGLVIVSGPRFGPQQLAKTALADLLPVRVDPAARVRDRESFNMQLTSRASEYTFMQLGAGSTQKDIEKSWENLGPLDWYQPVRAIHNDTNVLAEHPTATCPDDGRKQPLIAVRPYGRGEVVYLGFNETWRLRAGHGEELFRKFWSQVMWRLALNHSLGAEKRFVVRTDRQRYQVDERVVLTAQARNAEYQPLDESEVAGRVLKGELYLPSADAKSGKPSATQAISLTQVRKGLFEARFAAVVPGEHRVRVTDPITGKPVEWTFTVYSMPVERQEPVRNVALQEAIAAESGGRSCDLKDVNSLLEWIQPTPRSEASIEAVSLVNTWLCFIVVAGMLIAEWLLRKWVRLA
jgi:hypothetical protein